MARSVLPRTGRNLALTIPAFAIGALAGNGTATGRVTWADLLYLLAPAIIGLIEALATRLRKPTKNKRTARRAAP